MVTVYGNLQGLKASYIKQLEQLYEQRQPGNSLITPEFAHQLAGVSASIHQPICCYVNRRGQIVRVAVGNPVQSPLPGSELPRRGSDRLSGIRCLAVQPNPPDTATLIAMVRQRLDALVMLAVANDRGNNRGNHRANKRDTNATSEIKEVYLAHLVPDIEQPWLVSPPLDLDDLIEEDFDDLIHDWENELKEAGFDIEQFQGSQSDHDCVLLVGLMTDDLSSQQFEDGLTELVRLVESAGGDVVGVVRQKRSQPHPQTVVGQGKVEEIALQAQSLGANLVVFDRDISASQARNLEDGIGLRVVDRTGNSLKRNYLRITRSS